jgi:hypothetical protein
MMAAVTVGRNVEVEVKGSIAHILINPEEKLGPSKSGKTELVASIPGAIAIPGTDVKLGLNAYRPR